MESMYERAQRERDEEEAGRVVAVDAVDRRGCDIHGCIEPGLLTRVESSVFQHRCLDHRPDQPRHETPESVRIGPGSVLPVITQARRDSLTSAERKQLPIVRGVLDYFPDALLEVATASLAGNTQHLNGQPLHWDKSKSTDEADALVRHLLDRGKRDIDGVRHSAKVAWRALALLQREIEAEEGR